jgi:nucleoside phosphorylase
VKVRTASEVIQDADARGLRRVLIVTALPIEMKAVRAHLTDLGSCPGRDGNIYECGQFSGEGDEWLVVVAESGAGTHPAHSVVTYAHLEFGGFEITLFVGIGASRKTEAPIGSVVASSYLYFPYSGKYSPAGFSSRPHSLQVDARLVGLARKVQRDEDWPSRIVPPRNGNLPNATEYPKPFPPAALIAPIVSVEAVSAYENSELEYQINQHYGDAHALEMEGYGAVFAANLERTPSMIIRGISDMRSGKTSELDIIHQPVAAVHAAAFTFELLHMWGQVHRPEPKIPSGNHEASPTPVQPPAIKAPSPLRGTLVLNFDGSAEDFPPEKIAEVVATLRRVTGNQTIEVVGCEPGSFRLLLSATPDDLAKINTEEARRQLAEAHGVDLIGAVDEAEYRSVGEVLPQLRRASDALLDWPQRLPDGTWIDRPELGRLLGLIDASESSTTAVLGLPGSGKSALLAAFGRRLSERNVPLLAIKADFLDPSIATEDDLRQHFGFDELPSVVLARIAAYRPTILLIDQLDALATYVDLKTSRLSVLLNLVRKLGGLRNVHIVLSARTFEYEHDVRLKAVKAESLALELPAWSAVLPLLEAHGIQAAGWPTDAQELLRSPQALSTFLKLRERASMPPFRTYQAMLDQVWRERILQRPDGSQLARLASRIADLMAEKETLWLATSRFDDQAADLQALIASGILTPHYTGQSVGFTHQTLFEHALARSFAQGDGRLSSYILGRVSSLFVRPKLWAALTYLRGVETPTYDRELQTIWLAPNLRLHLRHLLIEFLGQQASPSNVEALLIEWALKSADRKVALHAIVGSPGWFDRFASSYIGQAMTDQATSGLAAGILAEAWRFAPARTACLVRERWLPDSAYDALAWSVLSDCPSWNENVLDLAVTVLRRTQIASMVVDHTVAAVGAEQPKEAAELVRAALERALSAATEEAARRASLPTPADGDEQARLTWLIENSPSAPLKKLLEGTSGWDSLEALAQADPLGFMEKLWPWFQNVFAVLRGYEDDDSSLPGFPLGYVGDFRFDEEHSLGLPEPALLGALRAAAETLAASDESGFLAWLAANQAENAAPAQRLFAHTLASRPERYASQALAFLLDNTNRLHIGSSEDFGGTAKRLIRAVSPHWSDEQLGRFEQTILAYAPAPRRPLDAKGRRYFQRYLRQIKLGLLSSLPSDRVSPNVQSLVREERRRFPDERMGATFHGPSFVGSPMSAKAMARASDDEILNAFRTVPDVTGWDHPTKWLTGGNIQLSREFANFAKESPGRATRLIRQFEPEFGTRASGYALDAMAESAEPSLIFELIDWLHERGFDSEEFRGSVARATERLVRRGLTVGDTLVATLEGWLATPVALDVDEAEGDGSEENAPEPSSSQEVDEFEGSAKKEAPDGSVLWGHEGISVLPSGNFPVLEALTRILLARAEHDRLLTVLTIHLARPENMKVWQSLLRFLVYVRPTSEEDLERFFRELFDRFPALRDTHEAAHLLAHAQWSVPDFVRAMLEGYGASERPGTQQTYGELAALMALVQPSLHWAIEMLADIVASDGRSHAKVGAAYAAANLWSRSDRRAACSELLRSLINTSDSAVWRAAFDLFRIVDEVTPERDWVALLENVADHIGEVEDLPSTFVVDRLQTLLPHEALLVARIARGLVSGWRTELGDLRTGTAATAPELVDLAITLHRLGPLTRDVGTALFEDMLEINAHLARQTLDQIDNRFSDARRPARRRLPRRSAGRRARGRNAAQAGVGKPGSRSP